METAEALAEFHHKRMREELGIAGDDAPHIRDLFHQKYRGSRYSFGYPACPNLEDQTKLFALLHPDETIGVHLTTGFLLDPEQSTSAHRGAPSGGEVFRGVGTQLLQADVFEDRARQPGDLVAGVRGMVSVFVLISHIPADQEPQASIPQTHRKGSAVRR